MIPAKTDPEVTGLAVLFAVLYFVQGVDESVAGLIAQPVRYILKSWGESPPPIATWRARSASG